MEFQEFRDELLKRVNSTLPTSISAIYQQVQKNNSVSLTGMLLDMRQESGISAVLYVEQLYECFLRGESMESISLKARDTLMDQKTPWELRDIYAYEKVRERIICRLVGAAQNQDRIDHEPHRKILDMLLTYAVLFDDGNGVSGLMSITNELVSEWGVTEQMIYDRAIENTASLMGEQFMGLADYCHENQTERTKMLRVLTNRHQFYGATAVLYSQAMREYAEQLECNLYIVPTSVHEVICMPRTPDECVGIKTILSILHADVVKEEDIMTDSIYIYDLADGMLKVEKVKGIERE